MSTVGDWVGRITVRHAIDMAWAFGGFALFLLSGVLQLVIARPDGWLLAAIMVYCCGSYGHKLAVSALPPAHRPLRPSIGALRIAYRDYATFLLTHRLEADRRRIEADLEDRRRGEASSSVQAGPHYSFETTVFFVSMPIVLTAFAALFWFRSRFSWLEGFAAYFFVMLVVPFVTYRLLLPRSFGLKERWLAPQEQIKLRLEVGGKKEGAPGALSPAHPANEGSIALAESSTATGSH